MGAILDLPSSDWFGDFSPQLTVHVIDSSRPQNLSSLFGGGENGERIVIWDDGGAERMEEERKAWEILTVSTMYACTINATAESSSSTSRSQIQTRIRTSTQSWTTKRRKTKMSTKRAAPRESVDH